MFSVEIHSHCIKEKVYKFRIPRKNQHWVYFYHSNLKVGPFGPPPVALELKYLYGAVTPKQLKLVLPVIKTTYIDIFAEILNLEGHVNRCIGLKVMAILLNGLILPTGGVASGRVCPAACAAGLFLDI